MNENTKKSAMAEETVDMKSSVYPPPYKVIDNWEFLFIGANIDSISVANSFGIDKSRVAN